MNLQERRIRSRQLSPRRQTPQMTIHPLVTYIGQTVIPSVIEIAPPAVELKKTQLLIPLNDDCWDCPPLGSDPPRNTRGTRRAPPLDFGPQTIGDRTFHILYHALRRARSSVENADILDSLFPGQNQAVEDMTMHPISANLNNQPPDEQYASYDEDQNIFLNEFPSTINDLHDVFHISNELINSDEHLNMCVEEHSIKSSSSTPILSSNESTVTTILTADVVSKRRDARPRLSVQLPNRPLQPSIEFLLDTTAHSLDIPFDGLPWIKIRTAGGSSSATGPINVKIHLNGGNEMVLPFVIMHTTPNLLGWPAIKQFRLLDGVYVNRVLFTQPSPPRFPAPINDLLSRCAPTIPMRKTTWKVPTLGNYKLPQEPIQQQPRHLSTSKLSFLNSFIQKMIKSEVISDGRPADFLSPLHLVAKMSKSHTIVPNEFRCTVDMKMVNALFDRLPCGIPSAPLTAQSIAAYKFKIVVDLKDAFFHLECPADLQFLFGICSQIGVHGCRRLIQGFLNSPTLMQHCIMSTVDEPILQIHLRDKIDAVVLSFLDDIGGGTNEGCPFQLLHRILSACVRANFTVSPSNIQIGNGVTHLGKLLTSRCEIAIAAHHRECIKNLIPPTTAEDARRCVAFFNFFREFCPRFAEKTTEMRKLAHSKEHDPASILKEFKSLQSVLLDALPLRPVH